MFDRYVPGPAKVFDPEYGVKALNAHYWQRALEQTDLFDVMPERRRQEWQDQIHKMDTPAFDEAAVRDNIEHLLNQRMQFLAEKVDGIFRNLSGAHVTNRPEGFSRRMIVADVFSEFGTMGFRFGYIHDMRGVLAKLMGRDQPGRGNTIRLLDFIRRDTGTWYPVDGFAFRIRVYKKGTAHIEIHPNLAWRLNQILACLYPQAIPPEHRRKPRRQAKKVRLFSHPIPFAVLEVLTQGHFNRDSMRQRPANTWSTPYAPTLDKHVLAAAVEIIEALGGVKQTGSTSYAFDYDASGAINSVVTLGMLPDRKAYQFYPTPDDLATEVCAQADVQTGHRCLEPSTGTGALARHMSDDTVCVEASHLHAKVLGNAGFNVVHEDFLAYRDGLFDRICMNPPFDQGRARAHLEYAASMLTGGGRLVAVLPAGLADKYLLPDCRVTFSPVYDNRFQHTNVAVVIVTAENPLP